MASDRLATLFHVSDIHFGDPGPGGDAKASSLWAKFRALQGLLGHQIRLLSRCETLFHRLSKTEPNLHLIVTGDLTTIGGKNQFELADGYFRGTLQHRRRRDFGLGVEDWRKRAIPGNHDHWPGRYSIVGPATPTFKKLFPARRRPF